MESFARPKISSQFLRVSESFKIYKDSFIEFINFFLFKRKTRGLELRGLLAVASLRSKPSPYPPLNPLNPSHVRSACNGAKALHAGLLQKTLSNFKIYERAYHGSKFSAKRSAA